MQGASVVRDDGTRGTVVAVEERGEFVVEFGDGSRLVLPPEKLTLQRDGTYRLAAVAADLGGAAVEREELVIPVVAEELTVETHRVARGKVRVHKRVETREEMVDAPIIHEEVVVEHLPVNKFVDVAPEVRDENGVLVIPLIEEVLVVEKRLLVREEVRISKRRTTTSTPQTVILRREVVEIEREELDGAEVPTINSDR